MATIITRASKGSRLTHDELDGNFNQLNSTKLESIPVATNVTLGGVKQGTGVSIAGDGTLSAAIPEYGYLTPQAFGAVGDGVTDDTLALSNWAVALATRNKNGYVPPGIYRISQLNLGVKFIGLNGRSINFGNAVFRVLDDNLVNGGQAAFYFENCTDCDFYSFTIDGNRQHRTPLAVYSHNVVINGGNQRLRFWACNSNNSVCDGWHLAATDGSTVANYPTDIHFVDCSATNSFRTNLTLRGSVRFKDDRGSYNGAIGSLPECGIDVNPDMTNIFGNDSPHFIDTTVSFNHGWGIKWDGQNDNINGAMIGVNGKKNVTGFMNIIRASILEIDRPRADDHPTATRGVIDIGTLASNVSMRHAAFNNVSSNQTSSVCIYIDAASIGTKLNDVETVNCACPTLMVNGEATVKGVMVSGSSAPYPNITNHKSHNQFIDIYVSGVVNSIFYSNAADTVVKDITVIDCPYAGGLIIFDTGSNDSMVRGGRFIQNSGTVPTGQFAISSNVSLSEVSNIHCGTGYTATNILSISKVNASNMILTDLAPSPLKQTTVVSPVTLAPGTTTYMGSIDFVLASFGDRVSITSEQALSGVLLYGSVWTSGGGVAWYATNNNATSVNVLTGNFRIRVLKD